MIHSKKLWRYVALVVLLVVVKSSYILAQGEPIEQAVRTDGSLNSKVVDIQSVVTSTLSSLANCEFKYSIKSDFLEETDLKCSDRRFIATTRYNNPRRTVWMIAFDGKQYQTFWNGDLWLTHSEKNINSQRQAFWEICPLTTMFTFLKPDESVAGGLIELSSSSTWADWIRRIKSTEETRINNKTYVKVVSADDYGSKAVLFDPEHNFYPSELINIDPQGHVKGSLDVKEWTSFDVNSHHYFVPSRIEGMSNLEDGSSKEFVYTLNPQSIKATTALKPNDFSIPFSQAITIKDLDLDVLLKQNDTFESRSSIAPQSK